MRISNLPNVEYVRSRLKYDPASGALFWQAREGGGHSIRSWNTRYAGEAAGSINSWGYIQVRLDGVIYPAHRLAWVCANGEWPENELDHINCNKADNRLDNLRDVRHEQNSMNRGVQKNSRSGLKGVSWNKRKQKYASQIGANGKHYWLGYFDCPVEAHAAYVAKAAILHGEFARL